MSKADLVLTNARIVTPLGVARGGVAIRDGRIVAIGDEGDLPPSADRYDCGGMVLLPGVVDPHVHLGGGAPYDHGYLQAMDAIRAVHAVWSQLKAKSVPFDEGRVYAMGGSGGGNVSQMAAKLAPRTFACVVDICGMPGLTDGIAFGTKEYGSSLNAGYSRDPASPARFYLNSAPAHRACPTRRVTLAEASPQTIGSAATANRRTIFKFIVPGVVESCQLTMGMTVLEPGSVWNTGVMPRSVLKLCAQAARPRSVRIAVCIANDLSVRMPSSERDAVTSLAA